MPWQLSKHVSRQVWGYSILYRIRSSERPSPVETAFSYCRPADEPTAARMLMVQQEQGIGPQAQHGCESGEGLGQHRVPNPASQGKQGPASTVAAAKPPPGPRCTWAGGAHCDRPSACPSTHVTALARIAKHR